MLPMTGTVAGLWDTSVSTRIYLSGVMSLRYNVSQGTEAVNSVRQGLSAEPAATHKVTVSFPLHSLGALPP